MADSPTRRSSIPILKQTNKTKSFQSFVNLKIIDSQDSNGRIHSPASITSLSPPILEFPKIPPRPQARSVAQLPKLEIDNDIIITKLCEENKRIKEHQTQLLSKYEEGMRFRTPFSRTPFMNTLHNFLALRENMEIQNKSEELQKELTQAKREISEKIHLQNTVEKWVELGYTWISICRVNALVLAVFCEMEIAIWLYFSYDWNSANITNQSRMH